VDIEGLRWDNMIPKVIHYVWFGKGEKSDKIKYCMESWNKFLPNFELKEWNEDNFPINYNKFATQSYMAGKFAFTSDVARLYALHESGGIYMDTDVEIIRELPLEELLNQKAFTGFEVLGYPATAVMGAEKGNPIIKEFLDYYKDRDFEEYTNTKIMSNILEKHGIDRMNNATQRINGFTVYPSNWFNDENGYAKHWMEASWIV